MNNVQSVLATMLPQSKLTAREMGNTAYLLKEFRESHKYKSREQYIDAIEVLLSHSLDTFTGLDTTLFPTTVEARVTFNYLIAGLVEDGGKIHGNSLDNALQKTRKYFTDRSITPKEPGRAVSFDEEGTDEPADSSVPTPVKVRKPKGHKRQIAKRIYLENKDTMSRDEILALFEEKAGLTPMGAKSYFHEFRKEHGGIVAKTEKTTSKIVKCRQIYDKNKQKTKDELVQLFQDEAECTPRGALTYYHKIMSERG